MLLTASTPETVSTCWFHQPHEPDSYDGHSGHQAPLIYIGKRQLDTCVCQQFTDKPRPILPAPKCNAFIVLTFIMFLPERAGVRLFPHPNPLRERGAFCRMRRKRLIRPTCLALPVGLIRRVSVASGIVHRLPVRRKHLIRPTKQIVLYVVGL